MTKINTENICKIKITSIFDEVQVIEYISKIPKHPNVLSPSRIVREGACSWLHYNVSPNGMTLRALIEKKPLHHNRLTSRLFHFMKIDPYKIILQLIDAYEFMLDNNLLLGQSNINPDCVWVEHEEHSTQLKVYVINTIETIVNCELSDKNYWSPELFSKYKAVTFYPNEMEHHPLVNHLITKQTTTNKLVRYNTRPSTITSVYSLGLIMYYIVTHNDPFDCHRLFADDKPYMSEIQDKELNYSITIALECDIRERPTLQQYREIIISNQKKSKRRKCTIL
jgi:hypothetical protein